MVLWFDLFDHTYSEGTNRIDWPDGGTYYDQDCLMIEIFDVIASEIGIMRNSKNG